MYSVLFSKIEFGMDLVIERLKEFVKPNSKVAIFPWAFPIEITSEKFEEEYFPIDGRKYNKYYNELKKSVLVKKILEYAILIKILKMTFKKLLKIVTFYSYQGEILKCFLKRFCMIPN